MITFSKKSWHRRIVGWGYKDYIEWHDGKSKPINLCPYMRVLLGIILTSPLIALYKILPEYCTFYHPDMTKIFLIVGSICATIHIIGTQALGFEWWAVPIGTVIMTGIVIGFTGLIFGLMALKDYLDGRPVKKHKPSIVREYMRAKHDKVCPDIEFEET